MENHIYILVFFFSIIVTWIYSESVMGDGDES